MADLLNKITGKEINRRDFLKASALASATFALIGGVELNEVADAATANAAVNGEGKWVPFSCYGGCGSKCYNSAYIVDGIPIRQKTDDTHPDSYDYPQQRGCMKGRSARQWVLSPDRLKYPMKRKHWEPGGGGGDVALRGQDEWERISWEEAYEYIAAEFTRIKEKYGNKAFLAPGTADTRGGLTYGWILNAMGGCTTIWGNQSAGGIYVPMVNMRGYIPSETADRYNILKSELIVLWANNPVWTCPGTNAWNYTVAKERGAKIIMIDPFFNPTAQAIADEWIPVRPGTDTALLAGIAYYMIVNDLQDQDFIDKYMLGFDADHMPAGSEGKENFRGYILGEYDGVPKTPEWAAEICGTPATTIESLAYRMATAKTMSMKSTWAPGRAYNGTNFAQMFYTVGWMTGNVGVVGSEVSLIPVSPTSQFGGPALVYGGASKYVAPKNETCTDPYGGGTVWWPGTISEDQFYGLPITQVYDAILTGKYHDLGTKSEKDIDIKCYFKGNACSPFNQFVNASKGYEAFRTPGKLDFVLSCDFFMTTDCLFADIVLPAATLWEVGYNVRTGTRDALYWGNKVFNPLFEAKTEEEWEYELGKKMGLDLDAIRPTTFKENGLNMLAGAQVIQQDGVSTENLVSITKDDVEQLGVDLPIQEGIMPIQEMMEKGIYQVPRSEGDNFGYTPFEDFIRDPEANPLATASGKFEVYCQNVHDVIARFGTTYIDPLPKYDKCLEGYEDSFVDWEKKVKGELPLQMITPHPLRGAHTTYMNLNSSAELFPNDILVNEIDTQAAGLAHGDTALITSAHGKMLRRVSVTNRIMPGVVSMCEANWTNLDDAGIDRGGNPNSITGGPLVGEGLSPYNSLLVKIEKWTGEPLTPDYLRTLRTFDEEGNKQW